MNRGPNDEHIPFRPQPLRPGEIRQCAADTPYVPGASREERAAFARDHQAPGRRYQGPALAAPRRHLDASPHCNGGDLELVTRSGFIECRCRCGWVTDVAIENALKKGDRVQTVMAHTPGAADARPWGQTGYIVEAMPYRDSYAVQFDSPTIRSLCGIHYYERRELNHLPVSLVPARSTVRLEFGTYVRTVRPSKEADDWTPEARRSRRWGIAGRVSGFHDSHGLVYVVEHDDGTTAGYEPHELLVESAPPNHPSLSARDIHKGLQDALGRNGDVQDLLLDVRNLRRELDASNAVCCSVCKGPMSEKAVDARYLCRTCFGRERSLEGLLSSDGTVQLAVLLQRLAAYQADDWNTHVARSPECGAQAVDTGIADAIYAGEVSCVCGWHTRVLPKTPDDDDEPPESVPFR